MDDLLTIRNQKKAKKPVFTRSDSHKKVRVGTKWRKSKGIQSKVRLGIKGYVRSPKVGWGSPKGVKGLTKAGLLPIVVANVQDLERIVDPKKEAAVIASTVGNRKKVDILKIASEKKIIVLNVKDPAAFMEKVKEGLSKKKEDKEKKAQEKKKKDKEKEEAAKKKEAEEKKEPEDELEQKVRDIDRKKEEKMEKDKILTKKDSL